MTERDGDNENKYIITMFFAKKLLMDKTITEKEYCVLDTKMQQKYTPKYGRLFMDIKLDKALK